MNSELLSFLVQVSWLVLCGMMLFSRFIFQAAGAVWMRAFLDAWKFSFTHRLWGVVAFGYGFSVLIGTGFAWGQLTWTDRSLAIALAGVLCGDGLLNLAPSWFGHFKERMQNAWVKRHRGTERAGDKQLFGTVNLFLGLASLSVALLVYWHRPVPVVWMAVAAVIALALMAALILACRIEGQRSSNHAG